MRRENPRVNVTDDMDDGMKALYGLLQEWMLNVIETLEFLQQSVEVLDQKKMDKPSPETARASDDGVRYED